MVLDSLLELPIVGTSSREVLSHLPFPPWHPHHLAQYLRVPLRLETHPVLLLFTSDVTAGDGQSPQTVLSSAMEIGLLKSQTASYDSL